MPWVPRRESAFTRRQARLVAARAAVARRQAEEAAKHARAAEQQGVREARKAAKEARKAAKRAGKVAKGAASNATKGGGKAAKDGRRKARKAKFIASEKEKHLASVPLVSARRATHANRRQRRRPRNTSGRRAPSRLLSARAVKRAAKSTPKATAAETVPAAIGIDRLLRDVRTGRFEQMMSALTAAGAAITAVEIFTEHDSASFGNKMMWWPIVIVPTAVPIGIASVASKRVAKTALPIVSTMILLNGLQGTYFHWRGIAQKPGGLKNLRYNIEMGPPLFAPLLSSLVGGMGLLAAVLRREGE